jgi:hypothetical protein
VFSVELEHHLHMNSKATPVTGRGGLECCEMLRIPYCLDNRFTYAGKILGLTHLSRSTANKHYLSVSVTHF